MCTNRTGIPGTAGPVWETGCGALAVLQQKKRKRRRQEERKERRGKKKKKSRVSPHLFVADEVEKVFHLADGNVLLHELAVVVQEVRDGLFGQQVIANLALHKAKVLGNDFLLRSGAGVGERNDCEEAGAHKAEGEMRGTGGRGGSMASAKRGVCQQGRCQPALGRNGENTADGPGSCGSLWPAAGSGRRTGGKSP